MKPVCPDLFLTKRNQQHINFQGCWCGSGGLLLLLVHLLLSCCCRRLCSPCDGFAVAESGGEGISATVQQEEGKSETGVYRLLISVASPESLQDLRSDTTWTGGVKGGRGTSVGFTNETEKGGRGITIWSREVFLGI